METGAELIRLPQDGLGDAQARRRGASACARRHRRRPARRRREWIFRRGAYGWIWRRIRGVSDTAGARDRSVERGTVPVLSFLFPLLPIYFPLPPFFQFFFLVPRPQLIKEAESNTGMFAFRDRMLDAETSEPIQTPLPPPVCRCQRCFLVTGTRVTLLASAACASRVMLPLRACQSIRHPCCNYSTPGKERLIIR